MLASRGMHALALESFILLVAAELSSREFLPTGPAIRDDVAELAERSTSMFNLVLLLQSACAVQSQAARMYSDECTGPH